VGTGTANRWPSTSTVTTRRRSSACRPPTASILRRCRDEIGASAEMVGCQQVDDVASTDETVGQGLRERAALRVETPLLSRVPRHAGWIHGWPRGSVTSLRHLCMEEQHPDDHASRSSEGQGLDLSMTSDSMLRGVMELVADPKSLSLQPARQDEGWSPGWVATNREGDTLIQAWGPEPQIAASGLRAAVAFNLLETAAGRVRRATLIESDFDDLNSVAIRQADGETWFVTRAEPNEVAIVREDMKKRYAGEPVVVLPVDKRLMDADGTARAIASGVEGSRPA
jgi:hypothetical protein